MGVLGKVLHKSAFAYLSVFVYSVRGALEWEKFCIDPGRSNFFSPLVRVGTHMHVSLSLLALDVPSVDGDCIAVDFLPGSCQSFFFFFLIMAMPPCFDNINTSWRC